MRDGRPSLTAQSVNLQRAILGAPANVIADPYARQLVGQPWRLLVGFLQIPFVGALGPNLLLTTVAGRTRFLDDEIAQAMARGVRQIVLLGAGYDSRALRLARPGVCFYEIDHPATQADKRKRLGGAAAAVYVGVDFTREDVGVRLCEAGFDTEAPAFFLWEGVMFYLLESEVRKTLSSVARVAAPGSIIAFDFLPRRIEGWANRGILGLASLATTWLGEPFRFRVDPGEIGRLLREEGWRLDKVLGARDLFTRYLAGSRFRRPARPFQCVATAVRTADLGEGEPA